jgi:ferredoxin
MQALKNKARELLAAKAVQVVIGYGRGSGDSVRAVFINDHGQVETLLFDSRCRQNLAVYLLKPEVKKMGKAALVANLTTLRAVLQLAAENQIKEQDLLTLTINPAGELLVLSTLEAIEAHVAISVPDLSVEERAELEKYEKLDMTECWQFWQEQFSRCLKCYACRAACPLCYCSRCTVECNQPQWIPVPAHDLGNLEWNVMRAMHLAGRCVNCGDCSRACPVGIPLYLLNQKLISEVFDNFGFRSGLSVKSDNAMSTFKPNDAEDFIK